MKLSTKIVMLLLIPAFAFECVSITPAQFSSALESASIPNFRDFSGDSAHHSILKGMEIKANSIEFTGRTKSRVLGTELTFENFEVVAPITVQTSCNYVSGTYATAFTRYSLSVALDTEDKARQEFLRQIKAYWKAKSAEELRDYQYMPAEKFLWFNSGRYVLYSQPESENFGETYLLYTSGKVIRVTLDNFQSGGGWGGLSSFIEENVIFKFSDTQIRCGYTTNVSPSQLMEWYSNGFFKEAPKP